MIPKCQPFLCQNEDCGVQVCAVDKALPSVMTKAEFEADVFAVGVFSIAEVRIQLQAKKNRFW